MGLAMVAEASEREAEAVTGSDMQCPSIPSVHRNHTQYQYKLRSPLRYRAAGQMNCMFPWR